MPLRHILIFESAWIYLIFCNFGGIVHYENDPLCTEGHKDHSINQCTVMQSCLMCLNNPTCVQNVFLCALCLSLLVYFYVYETCSRLWPQVSLCTHLTGSAIGPFHHGNHACNMPFLTPIHSYTVSLHLSIQYVIIYSSWKEMSGSYQSIQCKDVTDHTFLWAKL